MKNILLLLALLLLNRCIGGTHQSEAEDQNADGQSEEHPRQTPHEGNERRFQQELQDNVPFPGAHGASYADLDPPLIDDEAHDGKDGNAPDDENQRASALNHRSKNSREDAAFAHVEPR